MTVGPNSMSLQLAHDVSPPVVSDEQLVDRLKDGDTSAGKQLVVRHGQPLLRYLQRLTCNEHWAQELHQQTSASVLEHLDE